MDLKTAYAPYFKMGAAISGLDLHTPAHRKLLLAQFNSFTCENDMKPMYFLDREANKDDPEKYDRAPALTFAHAIPYLEFAKASGIAMRGHTLVWHNQTPAWFFRRGYNENLPLADRETMLARLESYIRGVLTYVQENYPGIVYAWDVVNEAIDEGDFRKSLWTETVGTDFVEMAFTYARRYAAPGVALFYNDYETAQEWKRDLILERILKPLKEKGLIDGMGMQSHLLMDHPDPALYRTALEMYGALGLQIHVTELDIHNADPSEASMHALAERYEAFFRIWIEAKKSGAADVTSVTFWNLLDEHSWLTGFRRETSYPLLFHGKCEPKEAYGAVIRAAEPDADTGWELACDEADFVTEKTGGPEMIQRHDPIWEASEYDYPAAYGFAPNLHAYIHPDEEERDCMLIVPGGGYCMVVPHEGELPAMAFYRQGMNVLVLTYTTDITMSVPLKKQPLMDISRAVRYIRKNADRYHVRDKKLVICGFSAGGHLCGSLAVHYGDVADPDPAYGAYSNRPDGAILCYPVLTAGEYTHADSIRALVGPDAPDEERDYFSLEKYVTGDTPPCFLWQTVEDDLVPVENSYLFAMALRKAGVPFAHYVFPNGRHGLSTADREHFRGWSGGEYTMEQTMRAAAAVKEGKGVNVSEQRRQELIEQFFSGKTPVFEPADPGLEEDVGCWTKLAGVWIGRL